GRGSSSDSFTGGSARSHATTQARAESVGVGGRGVRDRLRCEEDWRMASSVGRESTEGVEGGPYSSGSQPPMQRAKGGRPDGRPDLLDVGFGRRGRTTARSEGARTEEKMPGKKESTHGRRHRRDV